MKLSLFLEPYGRINYDFYPHFFSKWKLNISNNLLEVLSKYEHNKVVTWVTISHMNQLIGFCIIEKGNNKEEFDSIIRIDENYTIPTEILESYWVEVLKDYMMTMDGAKKVQVIINELSVSSIKLNNFTEEKVENNQSRITLLIDKKQSAQDW